MLKKIRGKVENNPIFKFRQFWESLKPKEQHDIWAILTVLRGEDGGSDNLKYETTARIRWEFFEDRGLEAKVIISPEFCCDDEIDKTKELLKEANIHFASHIRCAIYSLSRYVYKQRLNDLREIADQDRG